MNNRTQQRFDRSVRDALAVTRRLADLRHAEQQAYAEDAARGRPDMSARECNTPTICVKRAKRLSQADQLRAYEATMEGRP